MIVIDTNILVRLLTDDDVTQVIHAEYLFQNEQIYIPKTVLLELEWVLSKTYKFDRQKIELKFRNLLTFLNVTVENVLQIERALNWYNVGLGFADALHLAASFGSDAFTTFDKALIAKANKLSNWNPKIINPAG